MPLETNCTTYCLISIRTSYHFKSLRFRFAEFHAEFDVCSLLPFQVHAEIANVKAHMVTNTRVVQLQMFTRHATRHTKWRRSLLPSTADAFMYCHRLEVYGTSLEILIHLRILHVQNLIPTCCIMFIYSSDIFQLQFLAIFMQFVVFLCAVYMSMYLVTVCIYD